MKRTAKLQLHPMAVAALPLIAGVPLLVACSDLPTAPDPTPAEVESTVAAAVRGEKSDKNDQDEESPRAPLDLETALNDALLQESLAVLDDPELADELGDALDMLLDLVEEPDSRAYSSALAHIRQLVDDHLTDSDTSADDQIALSVLDVALLSI